MAFVHADPSSETLRSMFCDVTNGRVGVVQRNVDLLIIWPGTSVLRLPKRHFRSALGMLRNSPPVMSTLVRVCESTEAGFTDEMVVSTSQWTAAR